MDSNYYRQLTESLFADMQQMTGTWDRLRGYFMPRSKADAYLEENPQENDRRFNEVAAKCLAILTGAHVTLITPATDDWMAYAPPVGSPLDTSAGRKWYDNASRVVMQVLSRSNFMAQNKLFLDDRCGLGTGCLMTEKKRGGGIFFRHIPTGTFGYGKNEYGEPDKLVRKFKLTPAQAVAQFGMDGLEGTAVLQDYNAANKRYSAKHEFYQLVLPNDGVVYRDHKGMTPRSTKAFRSVYMLAMNYKVVQEGGYDTFPFMVSCFMPWGESVWGEPPAWKARNAIDNANKQNRIMNVLGDKAAVPPILEMAEQVKQIDLRAGGRTVVSREAVAQGLPREWANTGRYDIGLERLDGFEKKITEAFFVPFIQPVTSTPDSKDMTATEIDRRVEETIYPVVPSIYQCFEDYKQLLSRVFSMCYADGLFEMKGEQIPAELLVRDKGPNGRDETRLRVPEVELCGRMVQTIKQQGNRGFEAWVNSVAAYVQATGDTKPLDLIKSREGFREMATVLRVNPDNVADDYDIAQLDQQRAAQAEDERAAQMQQMQSQSTKNYAQAAQAAGQQRM